MSYDEFDDTTLRERIAANPRPLLVWLAGVLVLVALELGRFASGARLAGDAAWTAITAIAALPGWASGTVVAPIAGSTVGTVVGGIVFLVVALALLMLATPVVGLIVPISIVDRLGLETTPTVEENVERLFRAVILGVVVALLVATPLGSAVDAVIGLVQSGIDAAASLQTLTSRETIPNRGYQLPDGSWEGPWLGLSPGLAWALRVGLIYAYAFGWIAWLWKGYEAFREHYREADWTPRDDSINRFRHHYWGLFGVVVVFMFVVMAIWAPSISPVTAEANIYAPYEHEFTYHDGNSEMTASHGTANIQTRSQGGAQNIGPMEYDDFDRFHPFGTNKDGKDLFTFIAYGARVSLFIGVVATVLMAGVATLLALMTAYYKGLLDLLTIVASDSVISMPRFLVVLLLSVVFMEANHPIATIYDGGLLLALIYGATGWPGLWRSVRGPALQIAEQEWVDAARSYGQTPLTTMKKHMSPYIAGYMLVYASLSLGGVIIGVAALSFLGFGIQAPTPEWGRAINQGRQLVGTSSWHISTIPGVLIVLVVTAFNALGDGIRDAIDPQSGGEGTEEASGAAAAATGGGG